MKRQDGWLTNLNSYIDMVSRKPFIYGFHDCALFAAGGVLAMTGVDPAAGWRDSYATLAGGLKLLRKAGFDNHADFAASLFEEVHPSHSQIGDIAAMPVEDGVFALGIVGGAMIHVVQPLGGLGVVDLLTASRCFRIELA